jgi:hypothetical protein
LLPLAALTILLFLSLAGLHLEGITFLDVETEAVGIFLEKDYAAGC